MFRLISFSVVAIAATLLLLTANAEELRPSKLRPYELGPDGSLMVAGSPGLSVQSTARDLFELSRRTAGVSGAPASIDGNSELWEEASKSLARTSPKEFLILSGVSQENIDRMVSAVKSLGEDDNPEQLQKLISDKIAEAENTKDWKRMALFQYLHEKLDSEDLE